MTAARDISRSLPIDADRAQSASAGSGKNTGSREYAGAGGSDARLARPAWLDGLLGAGEAVTRGI